MACKVGRLVANESALFICDIQERFRNMIQYFPEIATVAGRLLKAAKILEFPVIVTEQNPSRLGSTATEVGLSNYPDLKPIEKMQFSMVVPEVERILSQSPNKYKSIILCGIETHVCVQGTCLSLLERGYDVHVVVDACSSRTMIDRMYSFERMKASGAWLTTSESVILGLVGGASHPKFKDCQKIIIDPSPDSGLLTLLSQKIA